VKFISLLTIVRSDINGELTDWRRMW